jgi:hypothetical protein
MALTRRELVRIVTGTALVSLAAACQTPSAAPPTLAPAAPPTLTNPLIKPRATPGAELTAVNASSELAVGRNRFTLGLIDAHNQAVTSGNVHVEFFKLGANSTAEKRADATAVFRSVGGASKGIWVSPVAFPEPGGWGAQVTLGQGSEPARVARMSFEVRPRFSAPGYDEPAIRSSSLTERDVNGDTSRICSSTPPCTLHTLSIASGLESGQKPLVVLFATPGFCTSATCAPELEAVLQLQQTYGAQANFIHVEIYQYPFDQLKTVSTFDEWHLPSDPWTFVIDQAGIVRERFEGAATLEELEPAIKSLLG